MTRLRRALLAQESIVRKGHRLLLAVAGRRPSGGGRERGQAAVLLVGGMMATLVLALVLGGVDLALTRLVEWLISLPVGG